MDNDNNTQTLIIAAAIGVAVWAWWSSLATPSPKCLCKVPNGVNPESEQALAQVIQEGALVTPASARMGPFALVIGVIVLVLIVSRFYAVTETPLAQPLTGFMEGRFRGR